MIKKHDGFGYDISQIAVGDIVWFVRRDPWGDYDNPDVSPARKVIMVGARDIVFEATNVAVIRLTRKAIRKFTDEMVVTLSEADALLAESRLFRRRTQLLKDVATAKKADVDDDLMVAIEAWLERRRRLTGPTAP